MLDSTPLPGCFIALKPSALLAPLSGRLQAIQAVVGIPSAHWAALYQPLFERFAGFVQQLPASEAHHHAGAGGLLRHGLEVVHEALRLRRTVLLPAGAPAEEVARQADLWTYATVCAGLLHDLGKPVTDLRITVDDEDWSPLAGPLPVGRPYRVTFQPDRRHRRHERVSPLLAPLLVPATGLSWLGREPEILDTWLATIQGDLDHAGPLGALIAQADGLSVARDLAGSQHLQIATARTKPLADRLLTGLRYLLTETNTLPLNRPGAAGFLDGDKLWLVSKRVLDALREHLMNEGQAGIPARNDRLMDELQQQGVILANGDRAIWHCQVTIGDWSQPLTCLCLEAARVWPDPAHFPEVLNGQVRVVSEVQPLSEGLPTAGSGPAAEDSRMSETPCPQTPEPNGLHVDELSGDEHRPAPSPRVSASIEKELPITDVEQSGDIEDLGLLFVSWLKTNLVERRVEINTPKARLHVLPEGLALVSPGIFRDFAPTQWQQAQKRFQKLRMHRRTAADTNIWTCQVTKGRRHATINVMLITEPARQLGVDLPPPNPAISLLQPPVRDAATSATDAAEAIPQPINLDQSTPS
jgi:integrating conjugative element relaxase (TIGR03760 family)